MLIKTQNWQFRTPSEIVDDLPPVAGIDCPHPISWADEERDLTAWLGNDLQNEAFTSLYKVSEIMANCTDADLHRDWNYLQASDHLYYMCTKWFSDGEVHQYFNPYGSPYDAFLNYMNVLSDFLIRVREYAEKSPLQEVSAVVKDKTVVKKAAARQPKPAAKKQTTTKTASTKKVTK